MPCDANRDSVYQGGWIAYHSGGGWCSSNDGICYSCSPRAASPYTGFLFVPGLRGACFDIKTTRI